MNKDEMLSEEMKVDQMEMTERINGIQPEYISGI